MKASDYIVQDREGEFDRTILHRPLFPVNMRLYKSSPQFRGLILETVAYMQWMLKTKMEDYTLPRGTSGANMGVPWNIIAVSGEVYLNPAITAYSEERVKVKSNCGSLLLPKLIDVWRHEWIDLEWHDLNGNKRSQKKITREQRGFTIQHEVDHNNGVLITHGSRRA